MQQFEIDSLLDRYGQALIDFNSRTGGMSPFQSLRHANEVSRVRKEIEVALLDRPFQPARISAVRIVSYPDNKKIPIIKGIRVATGWGLKESKDAADRGVVDGLTRAEAFYVKDQILHEVPEAKLETHIV